MDPLGSINIKKDSTYAMIKEANSRGWQIYCFESTDLFVKNSEPYAISKIIKINDKFNSNSNLNLNLNLNLNWFEILDNIEINLNNLNIILLRKDPPFNIEYIYATYLLDLITNNPNSKTIVANNPTSVRNNNEKLSTLKYPNLTPPNIVTANKNKILEFIKEQQSIIIKPLDGMGGRSIFKINYQDDNTSVIIDTITQYGSSTILAQKFIPEIKNGDKRVLLINGEPVPYGLARMPAQGEFRGNLAAGATGVAFELTDTELKICAAISSDLKKQGLYFVGIDIIGEYLTEINVTCPTCIQEIDQQFDINISKEYLDFLASKCT